MAKFVNKKIGEPLYVEVTIKFDGLTRPLLFAVIFYIDLSTPPTAKDYVLASVIKYEFVRIEKSGTYKVRSFFDTREMRPALCRLRVAVVDVEAKKILVEKAFPDVARLSY